MEIEGNLVLDQLSIISYHPMGIYHVHPAPPYNARTIFNFALEAYSVSSSNVKGLRPLSDLVNIARQWCIYSGQPIPTFEEVMNFFANDVANLEKAR